MFQKLKASLGIGAAKVDTVLESSSVFQGEIIRGDIHILGGDVEQAIEAISVKVCTEVKVETDNGINYSDFVLDAVQVVDTFTIGVGENRKLRFEIKLNDEVPITVLRARKNQCRVWLETALDIDFALDPKDRDYLEVKPLPVVADIIAMIEQSGFSLVKTDVEKGYLRGGSFSSRSGCYQEIEFKGGSFLGAKEIELSFTLDAGTIHCLAEIDRKFGVRGDEYLSFSLGMNACEREIEFAVASTLSR
ncbi:sporulation protein [uncultured Microbulbifer sp.]|uniref:sporulation protein n=1 Tax=uncultured Microbulbifer sp. TaxID=348147 RepID=UPI00260B0CE1|nr:sporulation protein [uncultured Microbulbifer sp.]